MPFQTFRSLCLCTFAFFFGTSDQHPIGDKNKTFNTLGPRQNGRYFADEILKFIFLNENCFIYIQIDNKWALVPTTL